MKSVFFFILTIFAFMSFAFSNGKDDLVIDLEYEIPHDSEYIFSGNTILALLVEEIKADGRILKTFDDIRDIKEGGIDYEKAIGDIGKIRMVWSKRNGYYVWNDGRGITFSENEKGFFMPRTNSYRFSADTKTLEIKYRVLLPSEGIDENALMESLPSTGIYTVMYQRKIKLR